MRALVQRVTAAHVSVSGQIIGRCGPGLMILVCAMQGDDTASADRLAAKIAKLRMFPDADGKTNLSIRDSGGSALVVSQFPLAADTSRGNRPGFSQAAPPDLGRVLTDHFATTLAATGIPVETGRFGADMQVTLTNDGPFTLWVTT